ncbi:nitrate- and nitrite sensing domain-containing protein [Actinomadura kijaniata]|uniref:nitrate- and nitrite sensing domain-containing protein n=1 Tax=Actinomadura kijaniata TaxID=46161 RepID=UPI00082C0B2A|nr:nitrate- and nitrite sensing domain-containing protein [Actinomadura kijaniata]
MRLRPPPESRKIRLRSKITAVLLSLIALWGFSAWVTVRDGWNLLQAAERDTTVGRPSKTLTNVLQDERRLSLAYLGARERRVPPPSLVEQRARTDQMIRQWQRQAHQAPGEKIQRAVKLTAQRLRALQAARAAVDADTTDHTSAVQPFDAAIDATFVIHAANAELDDQGIAADGRALIALTRARELLAREDAIMAARLAGARVTEPRQAQFALAVGAARMELQDAHTQLAPADQRRLDQVMQSGAFTQLRSLEDRLLGRVRGNRPPVTAAQWQSVTRQVLADLDATIDAGGDAVVERAQPVGLWVLARLVLAAGLGLVAVVASIALSITTSRLLLRQLHRLKVAAQELAEDKLPAVVDRLGQGERLDAAAEVPPLEFGDDEVGQVGQAINRVRTTAIDAAVQLAEQRLGFRNTLRTQALRTQALTQRQLLALDELERRRDLDPAVFGGIVRVDELATQTFRHCANLLLLTGEPGYTGARRPIALLDAVRHAVSQVEDYQRVTTQPVDERWLSGRARDVISLLAELIDNALRFSSADTTVEISSQPVPRGLALTIEDKGVGMSPERLQEANHLIVDPPSFDVSSTTQLGHRVVGLIARRHGISVTLKPSPYGGVSAVVLLPPDLFEDPPASHDTPATGTARRTPTGTGPNAKPAPVRLSVITAPQESSTAVATAPRPRQEPDRIAPAPSPEPRQTTEHGLPVRQPQQHLVPELRTDEPTEAPEPVPDDQDTRSPEEVRRIMSAYQSGTKKGRNETAPTPDE